MVDIRLRSDKIDYILLTVAKNATRYRLPKVPKIQIQQPANPNLTNLYFTVVSVHEESN
ncbi:hypothetical protein MKFW12EY_44480 (plasmid) [Methylomonas koyamae]|nr:hypothetical protein MKFW12EY_44480 [Methylomonas koyamae]